MYSCMVTISHQSGSRRSSDALAAECRHRHGAHHAEPLACRRGVICIYIYIFFVWFFTNLTSGPFLYNQFCDDGNANVIIYAPKRYIYNAWVLPSIIYITLGCSQALYI